jgi:hypothetical protein
MNLQLTELGCSWNSLYSLNISANTLLKTIHCHGNRMTQLNLFYNTYLEKIGLREMPELTEVCVWTDPFPPKDIEVYNEGSPNLYFTMDCNPAPL